MLQSRIYYQSSGSGSLKYLARFVTSSGVLCITVHQQHKMINDPRHMYVCKINKKNCMDS